MRAQTIRYREQGGLDLVEIDVPDPGPGEVQVRGSVCGICAWDLNTYRYGTAAGNAAPPGHEGIGVVVKVGPLVQGWAEGDRVVGGGFASLANLMASRLYRLPESSLPDTLWMVEPSSCVVTGVDHCQLGIGDRLAVVGCGYMGLMLVQCLARSFALEVAAFDVDAARLALACEFGAIAAYSPADQAFETLVGAYEGAFDTVVDASGAAAGFALSNRLVRRGGRINQFGWVHGPLTVSGDDWHLRGITIVNSSPAARLRDPFPVAIRLIEKGIIHQEKLVTHSISLSQMDALLSSVTRGQEKSYIKGVVAL
jgi:threonine dehydrogenase-like Zn-dependent dehydrogenase